MTRFLIYLSSLIAVATCWFPLVSRCRGERTAPIDYFGIPVQNYAVMNLSAAKPSGSEVDDIALDDSGNAAFGYKTAGADGDDTETLQIQKWKNGQLTEGAKFRVAGSIRVNGSWSWENDRPNAYVSLRRVRLLADGTVYGDIGWAIYTNVYTLPGHGSCFRCELTPTGGALPPLFLGSYADVYLQSNSGYSFTEDSAYPNGPRLAAVSTGGKTAGTFGFFNKMKSRPPMLPAPPGGNSSVSGSGTNPVTWVGDKIFDDRTYVNSQWDPNAGPYGQIVGQQACVPDIPSGDFVNKYFSPIYINDNGWAVGENDQRDSNEVGSNYTYDAEQNTITPLEGRGTALNNNNDILAQAGNSYLIEKGQVAVKKHFLADGHGDPGLIPADFQSQIRSVYPYLMSNRITGVDPAINPSQPILSIIFMAKVRRSAREDKWEDGNLLLRKFSDGSTDLHEIAGLENKWVTGINTSGVIAAIGDPDGDTGPTAVRDALLLVPVEVKINGTPKIGTATNLFSAWPSQASIVKIIFPPGWQQPDTYPPDFIRWSIPQMSVASNTIEQRVSWETVGLKEIIISIGAKVFTVYINVPDTGKYTEKQMAVLFPGAAGNIFQLHGEAETFANLFPNPKKDAMRHTYWNALSVSSGWSAAIVLAITTGHEYVNHLRDGQAAFSSTMDLHNNELGATINHNSSSGLPDREAIKFQVNEFYARGRMFIWEVPPGAPDLSEASSEGILINSNLERIFP